MALVGRPSRVENGVPRRRRGAWQASGGCLLRPAVGGRCCGSVILVRNQDSSYRDRRREVLASTKEPPCSKTLACSRRRPPDALPSHAAGVAGGGLPGGGLPVGLPDTSLHRPGATPGSREGPGEPNGRGRRGHAYAGSSSPLVLRPLLPVDAGGEVRTAGVLEPSTQVSRTGPVRRAPRVRYRAARRRARNP